MEDRQKKEEAKTFGNLFVYNELEDLQVQMGYDPIMSYVTHTFLSDEYVRTLKFPRGEYVMGEVYKADCEYNLTKGKLEVFDAGECTTTTLEAPSFGVFKAGSRRLFYSVQASELTTIHRTEAKTKLEAEKCVILDRFNSLDVNLDTIKSNQTN